MKDHFELSDTPLNRTLIATSDDGGTHWKSLGFIKYPATNRIFNWRGGIVPLDQDTLAFTFGFADSLIFGKRNPQSGKYEFDTSFSPPTNGNFGWEDFPYPGGDKNPFLKAYIWAHTVSGRVPAAAENLFYVFPDTIADKGHG